MAKYAVGVDYGTNSCRAVIVDVADGREVATAVYAYAGGEEGVVLDDRDPNLARQDPAEYGKGFVATVSQVVKESGVSAAEIVGVGIDTTGSSPIPVDAEGVPLSMTLAFAGDPNAMCWLWKDHTSHAEAAEITRTASEGGEPYLAKCGGIYSSEWFWSKILHCARVAPKVFEAARSWTECADYVPALITGTLKNPVRSVCAAGHKAMYNPAWDGLPSKEFLAALDPRLAELRDRLYDEAVPSDHKAGELTEEYAEKTGLRAGIPVAVGAFDAHMGAVGSGIRPGVMVKIMGTSTCDCMVAPLIPGVADIPGVSGIVPGSVLPDMIGIEAGQSAVGDIFAWFVKHLAPAGMGHQELTAAAERLLPGESGLLALDWNNGNRTVLVDPLLTGLLIGQTLHTTAAEVYRALIEATAFGARVIIERVEAYGVPIEEIIACGGIAEKSDMTMQIYADVCDRPIRISRSGQTPALGAAIFGALVGGAHPKAEEAAAAMTGTKSKVYAPGAGREAYARLYAEYKKLYDAFGGVEKSADLGGVMKNLIAFRDEVRHQESL